MVEGGAMDESAHVSDVIELTKQMRAFDDAVSLGLRFAAENPDTIVIVTADHDTGGLSRKRKQTNLFLQIKRLTIRRRCLNMKLRLPEGKNPILISARYHTVSQRLRHTNNKVQGLCNWLRNGDFQ